MKPIEKLQSDFSIPIEEGILLKLPRIEETPILFALTDKNRTHLREFLGWVDDTKTVNDTKTFIEEDLKNSLNLNSLLLTIWYFGKPVGMIGCHGFDWLNRMTSIGYWLDQDHLSKGIMTKSLQALCHFVYRDLAIHRIEIRCAIGNIKSQRVAENVGFIREGTLRDAIWHYGNYFDAYIYGLVLK